MKITDLDIESSTRQPIPNRFFEQETETDSLGLVLPGLNYSCDMPLLYYPTNIFLEKGMNVLQMWADYREPGFQALSRLEQAQRLGAEALSALQAGLTRQNTKKVFLLGKSIGTISMAFLLTAQPDLPIYPIWLTPLLQQSFLVDTAEQWNGPSLWIASSADRTYQADSMQRIQQIKDTQIQLFADADHRLEVAGNLARTLQILGQVCAAITEFTSIDFTDR